MYEHQLGNSHQCIDLYDTNTPRIIDVPNGSTIHHFRYSSVHAIELFKFYQRKNCALAQDKTQVRATL